MSGGGRAGRGELQGLLWMVVGNLSSWFEHRRYPGIFTFRMVLGISPCLGTLLLAGSCTSRHSLNVSSIVRQVMG